MKFREVLLQLYWIYLSDLFSGCVGQRDVELRLRVVRRDPLHLPHGVAEVGRQVAQVAEDADTDTRLTGYNILTQVWVLENIHTDYSQ